MQYQYNGYNNPGLSMDVYQQTGIQQPMISPQQIPQHQQPIPNPYANFTPPTLTMDAPDGSHNSLFTVVDSGPSNPIKVDNSPDITTSKSKKRGRKKKETVGGIVKADGTNVEKVEGAVEETPTSYTYMETTAMLKETLGQIDAMTSELATEFQNIKHSRTMRNKYNLMVGVSETIGSLISNRIAAIREINNSITKSNDMDYKKLKDVKAAQAVMNDDKYIADVYQAMISNPANLPASHKMPQIDNTIFGSGIVRANIQDTAMQNPGAISDVGYLNYMSNLTPEQNLMRYENNPNVKQVVVYDAVTGHKFFQMMDISTGEVIHIMKRLWKILH